MRAGSEPDTAGVRGGILIDRSMTAPIHEKCMNVLNTNVKKIGDRLTTALSIPGQVGIISAILKVHYITHRDVHPD